MTDEHYKQLLEELAKRNLRVKELAAKGRDEELESVLAELSAASRLVRKMRESPDDMGTWERAEGLLRDRQEKRKDLLESVVNAMVDAGILDALNEEPEAIFGNLRRSAIPDEDVELLHRAGVQNPEMEIEMTIEYSNKYLATARTDPFDKMVKAAGTLRDVRKYVHDVRPEDTPRKRKLFNGIGKILAGAVTGTGNVLLVCGTIAAPNPATAYGSIASCALAVGSVCQGIGELRGE